MMPMRQLVRNKNDVDGHSRLPKEHYEKKM